jgi:hypothetical protein
MGVACLAAPAWAPSSRRARTGDAPPRARSPDVAGPGGPDRVADHPPPALLVLPVEQARCRPHRGHCGHCWTRFPCPQESSEPLRIGQAVVFTGCDPLVRARLEGRAQAAGLRVTGSVSRRTVLLVTDGGNPHTVKARKARSLDTRVVHPDLFTTLVGFV